MHGDDVGLAAALQVVRNLPSLPYTSSASTQAAAAPRQAPGPRAPGPAGAWCGTSRVRDAGRPAAGAVAGPVLGQVERPVQPGAPPAGGVAQEHPHLAVGPLAQRPNYCRATPADGSPAWGSRSRPPPAPPAGRPARATTYPAGRRAPRRRPRRSGPAPAGSPRVGVAGVSATRHPFFRSTWAGSPRTYPRAWSQASGRRKAGPQPGLRGSPPPARAAAASSTSLAHRHFGATTRLTSERTPSDGELHAEPGHTHHLPPDRLHHSLLHRKPPHSPVAFRRQGNADTAGCTALQRGHNQSRQK